MAQSQVNENLTGRRMKKKIQIKKYGNRRLYDMENKRYITLDELTELIQNDYEVQILDSKTGEDLTQVVLTQLILENQKRTHNSLFTSEILHQMIQYQDQSISEFFKEYLPNLLNAYVNWQQEAQNQFMHWAQLGWSANRYSRDLFMPGLNLWNMGTSHNVPPQPGPATHQNGSAEEIEQLKKKIDDLENRLNKPKKKR
jgi:polyhydroxyalkanoate synthesis repressor PhaR